MFIKTIKSYRSLTPEQKMFIKDGGITNEMPISKWVKLLKPICHFDALIDPIQNVLKKCPIIFLFLAFFDFFFEFTDNFYTIAIFISLAIITFWLYKSVQRVDVNDNIREVLYPLLQMLAVECGYNAKVTLRINFHKRLAKHEAGKVTQEIDRKTTRFDYHVLTLNCKLADKTQFSLKVLDTILKRNITKRSGGKIKYKTKYKLKRRIGIVMRFSTSFYKLNEKQTDPNNIFKEKQQCLVYKQTIKQSSEGKTALIGIESILEKINQPYSYLLPQEKLSTNNEMLGNDSE